MNAPLQPSDLVILQNATGADLILPRYSADNPPKAIIAPGGMFLANQYLADSLVPNGFARLIQVVQQEEPRMDVVPPEPAVRDTHEPDHKPGELNRLEAERIDEPEPEAEAAAWVQAWWNAVGGRWERAGKILALVELSAPMSTIKQPSSRHSRIIDFGKTLLGLVGMEYEGKIIEAHRRGNSYVFRLAPIGSGMPRQ